MLTEASLDVQMLCWILFLLYGIAAVTAAVSSKRSNKVVKTLMTLLSVAVAVVILITAVMNSIEWTAVISAVMIVVSTVVLASSLLDDSPSDRVDGEVIWSQRRRNWCRTPFSFTKYTLTDSELGVDTGLIHNVFDTTKLFRITDLQVSQTLLQRAFGISDIKLEANDPLSNDKNKKDGLIVLKNIINGHEVRKTIQKAVDAARIENRVATREFMSASEDAVDDADYNV